MPGLRWLKMGIAGFLIGLLPNAVSAEPVTIAALGDSLTAGYGLPDGEGFVPQLQAWLIGQGHDVIVLNAGVSGDTTAGGRARLDWTLTPDVDAVIVELGGNDLLRGLAPEEARSNLEAILQGITDRGLPSMIAGMRAPGNYGAEYKRDFDAIYPDLAATYGSIYYPEFLSAIAKDGIEAGMSLMQADGIHPNRDGVARIVADIGPAVEQLIDRAR